MPKPYLPFVLAAMAGWINRGRQHVLEYRKAENRILREHMGGRRLLSDARRRRLGDAAKRAGRWNVRSNRRRVLLLGVVVCIAGCSATRTTSVGVVGVERKQMMVGSAAATNRAAGEAYGEILRDAQSTNRLNTDPAQIDRVRVIAGRLTPVTGVFRPDAPGWRWQVNVIRSQELNAWCMPGGRIAVYSGLLEQLDLTDAELAAVIGHEIAHALREHGREKEGPSIAIETTAVVGGMLIGSYFDVDPRIGQSLIRSIGGLAFLLPNSRVMEQEADRIAVELTARAGYDPYAAIPFWQKMRRARTLQMPLWLSTHPSHESRISDLEAYADRVQPLYAVALNGGGT